MIENNLQKFKKNQKQKTKTRTGIGNNRSPITPKDRGFDEEVRRKT